MTSANFQHIAHTIPQAPGIYKYFDAGSNLLYVGKAKNLRKRVSSYFTKTFTSYKTHELVQRIDHIEFTIVDSEQDAFLLENALIKQFRPRFNIDLKDDKTYPFLVIKKEPFPRVFLTRRKINDGSEYLGPFTSVGKVRELLDFIRHNIPLRTCKLNLTESNIRKGKFKVCLEYHLGNCKGPCEGFQSLTEYQESLQQVKNLMKGNLSPVMQQFRKEMQQYAMDLQFEKAEMMRKKLDHLEQYQSRSVIVSKHLGNIDVFSLLKDGDIAYVNYLMVQNGTIVQTHTIQLETHLDESEEEVLAFAIGQMRSTFNSMADEIIVPFELPELIGVTSSDTTLRITIPRGGDKKKLLDLSLKNVNYFQEEIRRKKTLNLEGRSDMEKKKVLYQLQEALGLQELPLHIECFDNSNFQGSYPVSAMVCFRDGIPSKKDYRHYNVKTVKGINDFATMKEVVFRRYRRLRDESEPFPQLVIIDGGKGQLGAAMEAIRELQLVGEMTVVGLAKNEEEIFFPGDAESVKLPYNSEPLKLIRSIRDEVHRFGISFHRQQRSKGTFRNELQEIRGIGKATADQLLKTFRSVTNIRELTLEALADTVGTAKAKLVWDYFHNGDGDETTH
ncbi:excinuclease ABC subunit UvrC [Flavihumibacter sp. ZG627]|uniref:excinuclease ABC subunit UvrC n=1 Tax=Flavihumibacter sp. ZG627 TaxID=1463156 RepID=UPI00057CC614|nr:excinuclease ABC subunit UvrC [Flavihumibacter sp. ZG627]KIC92354.1 excinuclease ABC subunit C [Flavihumibacter sp. ZG627]